jgi:hypothetical protein
MSASAQISASAVAYWRVVAEAVRTGAGFTGSLEK